MKLYFKIVGLAAGLLFMTTACQKQVITEPESEPIEAVVELSVSIPDNILTKAYSDGLSANDLYYAVYDAQTKQYLQGTEKPLKFEDGSLTRDVNIRLAKNYSYDIVFWAQAPEAPYTFDKEAKTVTVDNYTSDANDESRDAFYQLVEGYEVVDTTTIVVLNRPFAQINFLAKDYYEVTSLGLSMTSKVQIPGLPSVLNVLDRTVGGEVSADFLATDVPVSYGEEIILEGDDAKYAYVSMNYVLAPQEKGILGNVVGYFYYNSDEIIVSAVNVPYQRNYRTNIIGEFFTGTAHFVVNVVPIYNEPSYDL